MHLGWSMFLLYAMREYPRLTLGYLFLSAYADCFLPFIHLTCPALEDIQHLNLYTYQVSYPCDYSCQLRVDNAFNTYPRRCINMLN